MTKYFIRLLKCTNRRLKETLSRILQHFHEDSTDEDQETDKADNRNTFAISKSKLFNKFFIKRQKSPADMLASKFII